MMCMYGTLKLSINVYLVQDRGGVYTNFSITGTRLKYVDGLGTCCVCPTKVKSKDIVTFYSMRLAGSLTTVYHR